MSEPPFVPRLGRLLSTHPVDSGRYWRTGAIALAIGLSGVLLGGLLIAFPEFVFGSVLGVVVLLAFGALPVAAVQFTRALRSGTDASYLLYEHGLAHRSAGRTRTWTWPDIVLVRARPEDDRFRHGPDTPVTPIDRAVVALSGRYRCVARFTDGARISIDGYTAGGRAIVWALLTARPDAVVRYHSARLRWITVVVLPVLGVLAAVVVVRIFRYLNAVAYDAIDPGAGIALALTMLICVIVAVFGFTTPLVIVPRLLREAREPRERWADPERWRPVAPGGGKSAPGSAPEGPTGSPR